ncbi:MAG: D-Ala-D-Ala carboxypeptidase family metallohydrolase, partial [Pseudomonadota bacterium]
RKPVSSFGRENVGSVTTSRKRRSAASVNRTKPRLVARARSRSASSNALPGVNARRVFSIEEDGNPDVSQRSLDVTLKDPIRVAAVTNMARRGTHGLLLQRPSVKVGCFPPQLVRLLKQVERKFGRTPIVTSGYRSPAYNRRIRGAKNSQHVQCRAADIQVKGVSKWTLARYLRGLPGRGGVGTYCHTKSVHIDIGSKRDWNRKCRRKRRRA